MRTSLQLDHDVEPKLRSLVRKTGRSLRRVINDLLREALALKKEGQKPHQPFKVRAKALEIASGVDSLKFNQLVDQLDAEQRSEKRS